MIKSVKVVLAAAAVVAVSGIAKYGYEHKDEISSKVKEGSKQAKKTVSDHLEKIKAEAKKKMEETKEYLEETETDETEQDISEETIEDTADEMLQELNEEFEAEKENSEE